MDLLFIDLPHLLVCYFWCVFIEDISLAMIKSISFSELLIGNTAITAGFMVSSDMVTFSLEANKTRDLSVDLSPSVANAIGFLRIDFQIHFGKILNTCVQLNERIDF
jgi:hypothetical protein